MKTQTEAQKRASEANLKKAQEQRMMQLAVRRELEKMNNKETGKTLTVSTVPVVLEEGVTQPRSVNHVGAVNDLLPRVNGAVDKELDDHRTLPSRSNLQPTFYSENDNPEFTRKSTSRRHFESREREREREGKRRKLAEASDEIDRRDVGDMAEPQETPSTFERFASGALSLVLSTAFAYLLKSFICVVDAHLHPRDEGLRRDFEKTSFSQPTQECKNDGEFNMFNEPVSK